MISSRFKGYIGICGFAIMVCLFGPMAAALDVDDVKTLLQNKVSEDVIINVIKSDETIFITNEQANELRAHGASEKLIAALWPRAITMPADSVPPVISSPADANGVASAEGNPIVPVPVEISSSYPARHDKEGWLSITNRDWIPYYLNIDVRAKRMFLNKQPNGGVLIQSGENVVLNVRKEGYKLYGESGKALRVKIREGETTTLSLDPFGIFGNSGLTGVSTARDNVGSEVLFSNYVPAPPPVIVQEPEVIVVPGYRPPPVIVQEPEVIVVPGYRPPPVIVREPDVIVVPGYRPPPPPPVVYPYPPYHHRREGSSIYFHFGK